METIRTIIAQAKQDARYWQFPLVLSLLTTGSISLAAWVYAVRLPWALVLAVKLLFIVVSTLTAWWLLLGTKTRAE